MKKLALLTLLLLLAAMAVAEAGEQTRIFDRNGRSIGTATPSSDGSMRFRDERGRSLGTSSTRENAGGSTTDFFDARGNRIGSSVKR